MVKVSIIIPVYNTENYLRECLDSVVNQTFKDIEIICINDGSTDKSLEILKEYEKHDERIKIISQQNFGQSVARNNGIKFAKGKYVYFMDSDDYLELTALEEIYSFSENNNLDLLIFKLINFDDEVNEKYTSNYYEMEFLRPFNKKIFNYNDLDEKALNIAVSPPGKLFKKDLIQNIKFPEGLIFEDNVFFTEAMFNAKRVSFYDKHLYNRRKHETSTTQINNIKFADSIIIINQIFDLFKKYGEYENYKYDLAKKKIEMGYFRYSGVGNDFKEDFFCKLKDDFKNFEEEYCDDFLEKLTKNDYVLFKNVLSSVTHDEFDLKMDVFNLKHEISEIKKNNIQLKKKVNKFKKENELILCSYSWKITKPLREISKLFK